MESTLGSISELTKRISSYEQTKYVISGIIFVSLVVIIIILRNNRNKTEKLENIDYENNENNNFEQVDEEEKTIEHMSGGTLQQLFAQDAQDINLNGQISNANNLTFNIPSKVLQGTQRGTPTPNNNVDTEAVVGYTGDSGLAPFPYITPPSIVKQG